MPYLMDNQARTAELVDATLHLAATQGAQAVTLRKIAGVARLSPSSVVSQLTNRHRLVDLMTKLIGLRVVEAVDHGGRRHGLAALIPDEERLPLVRAWLVMVELTRHDEAQSEGVLGVERELRDVVGLLVRAAAPDELAVDRQAHDDRVELVVSLAVGLWWAMAAGTSPMPVDRARALFALHCESLGLVRPLPGAA